jgi:hypothetical protein
MVRSLGSTLINRPHIGLRVFAVPFLYNANIPLGSFHPLISPEYEGVGRDAI